MRKVLRGGLLFLLCFASCQHKERKCIKVAATPVPHAEILQLIVPDLEKRGVVLKVIEVEDYTVANRLLAEKQVDANFFQHRPYLEDQKRRFGFKIKELAAIHIEPLGIYSEKIHSLDELKEGDTLALPHDPTNEARALLFLEHLNLITLKKVGFDLTVKDIQNNPKKLKIKEIDAASLPRVLPDVTVAIIPLNFVLQANIDPSSALAEEDESSAYVNIVVIREGDERQELVILKEELLSPKIEKYLEERQIVPVAAR